MSSPFIPCPFSYNDAPAGGQLMPMVVSSRNPSNSQDKGYDPGYLWLSDVTQGGSGNLYFNGGFTAGSPAWTLASSAAGALNTLSDGSTTVTASGGNIAIDGTADQINVISNAPAHKLDISLPVNIITPGSMTVTGLLTLLAGLTITGNVTITGNLAVADLTSSGATTLATTGANISTFGNTTGASALTLSVGTGNFLLQGAATSTMTIGTGLTTGTILIGGTAQTGNITLGSSSGTNAVRIGNGAGTTTVSIANGTAGANVVNICNGVNVAAQDVNIGSGACAADMTVDILNGNATAGTLVCNIFGSVAATTPGTVNIATGAVAHVVNVGSASAGAIAVDTAAGISLDAATVSNFTVTGAGADLNLLSVGGSVLVESTENAALAVYLHANGGTSETIRLRADQGTGAASIDLLSDVGGITLTSGLASTDALNLVASAGGLDINAALEINIDSSEAAVADAVRIVASAADGGIDVDSGTGGLTLDTTGSFSIDGAAASNVTVTGAGIDLTLASVLGSVLVSSTENAALAIRLHANGGTSETIQIHSDQGTGVGSVNLLSDVGGLTLRATGFANADAINLEAVAGGVDVDAALQINVASSQAAATAIQLTASDAAGGITATVGTGNFNLAGNLSFSTSGNKLLSANVGSTTAAGANSFGTVALVGGTATVATTAVSASSMIFLQCQALGTVAAAKAMAVTAKTASTSFVITSADATDTSTIAWLIVN